MLSIVPQNNVVSMSPSWTMMRFSRFLSFSLLFVVCCALQVSQQPVPSTWEGHPYGRLVGHRRRSLSSRCESQEPRACSLCWDRQGNIMQSCEVLVYNSWFFSRWGQLFQLRRTFISCTNIVRPWLSELHHVHVELIVNKEFQCWICGMRGLDILRTRTMRNVCHSQCMAFSV